MKRTPILLWKTLSASKIQVNLKLYHKWKMVKPKRLSQRKALQLTPHRLKPVEKKDVAKYI